MTRRLYSNKNDKKIENGGGIQITKQMKKAWPDFSEEETMNQSLILWKDTQFNSEGKQKWIITASSLLLQCTKNSLGCGVAILAGL